MKKLLVFLIGAIATTGSFLHGATPSSSAPSASECSQLPPDQQGFSAQLTTQDNKIMFCSRFTPLMRQQAMQRLGKPDPSGNKITADQAVEQIMAANGLLPPSQQLKPKTYGGACPVQ